MVTKQLSLQTKYNILLKKRPLLVKILTGSVLSSLNELISTTLTSSKGNKTNLQVLYKKIILMMFYGGLINSPINHYGYKLLVSFTKNLKVKNSIRNLIQLCCSLTVITPIQVLLLIVTLTIVNLPILNANSALVSIKLFINDFKKILGLLQKNIKSKFPKVYLSSLISSTLFVSFAQHYLQPENWSIFFSFAYTALNTSQNIYIKLKQKEEKESEQDNLAKKN
ncbi:uncharacterized protein SCODWIG_02975 [Saccharomycodes ludwigii]|uniref:Uncharacterized protein n=1 Tax=Saccharomycodes ludwigii TaxID=36035 RepID=A0A376B9K4_9ASCO|nr:uncharacterized protein SCODWIG_02975 [Saccharomycodes ludwigii]